MREESSGGVEPESTVSAAAASVEGTSPLEIRRVIVVCRGRDGANCAATELVANRLKGPETQVEVLDVTELEAPVPYWLRLRLEDQIIDRLPSSPRRLLQNRLATLGIGYSLVPRRARRTVRRDARQLVRQFPADAQGIESVPVHNGFLGRSLWSQLITNIALSETPNAKRHVRYLQRGTESFLASMNAVGRALRESQLPTSVVILNGRFPAVAGAAAAGSSLNAPSFFYEWQASGWLHHAPYAPHDRVALQQRASLSVANMSRDECLALVDEFVTQRSTDATTNPFITWYTSAEVPAETEGERPLAVLFTSSPDEFVGVGSTWDVPGWNHQYEALRAAVVRLDDLGYRTVVRIHPNAINKSWGDYKRVCRAFTGLPCEVVLPLDPANSYALIREAAVTVVWGSTVGLESLARGVPTFVLGRSTYDLIPHLRVISDPAALAEERFEAYSVTPRDLAVGILASLYYGGAWHAPEFPALAKIYDEPSASRIRLVQRVLRLAFAPVTFPRSLALGPAAISKLLARAIGRPRTAKVFRRLLGGTSAVRDISQM